MDQVVIRTWGNSQGIRIPKDILEKMHLKISDVLNIEMENDTIVLRKQFVHKTFEERLGKLLAISYNANMVSTRKCKK